MVFRIFVEKKPGLDNEARALKNDIAELLQISGVENVRLFNRYDVDDIEKELFDYSVNTVFAEPQLDNVTTELPEADVIFAVEPLPGQFDQRASSAAECIQIISKGDRPEVKTAKVYALYGNVTEADVEAIKKFVINAVESREADMALPETLVVEYEIPTTVETVEGFIDLNEEELAEFIKDRGLAMDLADIKFCQEYFKKEDRNPTITEVKMIDTYWSDHCRHTTFNTIIDSVKFEDENLQAAYDRYVSVREGLNRTKPVTLMDLGTIAVKQLKKDGKLTKLDESEEINACTVKIKVEIEGQEEDWLLLFKNETHNHPTEIEPFGGAATCVGGAIRDPLSGRSYVYAAMRVTGAGDPLVPVSETIPGKLPQRKLVATAAAGYSSYGNQI
ncbi:MAG: phosphoribosylformylglycinamidine synthase, partial [Firmicutes bacterium]|nr:phosphoribosylformylglycinamidine synthase [Bacillota bacterium]